MGQLAVAVGIVHLLAGRLVPRGKEVTACAQSKKDGDEEAGPLATVHTLDELAYNDGLAETHGAARLAVGRTVTESRSPPVVTPDALPRLIHPLPCRACRAQWLGLL